MNEYTRMKYLFNKLGQVGISGRGVIPPEERAVYMKNAEIEAIKSGKLALDPNIKTDIPAGVDVVLMIESEENLMARALEGVKRENISKIDCTNIDSQIVEFGKSLGIVFNSVAFNKLRYIIANYGVACIMDSKIRKQALAVTEAIEKGNVE